MFTDLRLGRQLRGGLGLLARRRVFSIGLAADLAVVGDVDRLDRALRATALRAMTLASSDFVQARPPLPCESSSSSAPCCNCCFLRSTVAGRRRVILYMYIDSLTYESWIMNHEIYNIYIIYYCITSSRCQ